HLQARGLRRELGPGRAKREAMVPAQLVVEVLGGEPPVAIAIKGQQLVHLVDGDPLGGGFAEPPVAEPRSAFVLVPISPAPERPLAHTQDLGGLRLAQTTLLPAAIDVLTP